MDISIANRPTTLENQEKLLRNYEKKLNLTKRRYTMNKWMPSRSITLLSIPSEVLFLYLRNPSSNWRFQSLTRF